MGDDLASAIEGTIGTMGSVIKRPPMTEKLLKKPPFRFLHDVITEVIKTTGFLEGLYTPEEMLSENVKEKPLKIAFLQKAIDATAMATGALLAVRPSKIVAGHEPELTNAFLQTLARGVQQKVDSSAAVAAVLSGKKPGKDKDKRSSSSKERSSSSKERSSSSKERNSSSKERSSSSSKERSSSSSSKKRSSHSSSEKPPKAKLPEEGGDDEAGESRSRSSRQSSSNRRDKSSSGRDRSGSRERPDKTSSSDRKSRSSSSSGKHRSSSAHRGEEEAAPAHSPEVAAPAHTQAAQDDDDASNARPSTARRRRKTAAEEEGGLGETQPQPQAHQPEQQEQQPQQQQQQDSFAPPAAADACEEDAALPGNVQRSVRRRERPSSARPAPPRARRTTDAEEGGQPRAASGREAPKVAVITASQDQDDDDDDDTFIVETQAPSPAPAGLPADDANEEHGALMQKILAKKAEDKGDSEHSRVNDANRQKERELAEKEIKRLQEAIQTVCRSANPLGKVVDYIQEDLDGMRKELEMWRKESAENTATLAHESSATDMTIQPLRVQLRDLDQQIVDQEDMIRALKSATLENEARIQDMLSSVAHSAK